MADRWDRSWVIVYVFLIAVQILAIRYYRIMAYNQSRDEHDAEEPMDDDKWVAHCTIDFNNHINIMQFSV